MVTKYRQLSLKDTFSNCQDLLIEDSPSFFQLLDEHFDIQEFIPSVFTNAFYQHLGRLLVLNSTLKKIIRKLSIPSSEA